MPESGRARLAGRTALITGGESGIGLATARLFAAEGARVHLAGLDEEALARAVEQLGPAVSAERADVTDPSAVAQAVANAVAVQGRLDVVFSNAGISGPIVSPADYPVEDFRRVLDVHILGAFHVLKYALPVMAPGGSVVINSSVVGLTVDPSIGAYATAKHAQVGLMRVAAKEVAARGIRVNTIHPGPTDTAFQRMIETAATGAPGPEAARIFDQMIPLGRHALAEEVARVTLFLASEESSFITGATVAVDGGMSI